MKKLLLKLIIAIMSAVMLFSCSDSNPVPDPKPGVDYLVMVYGVGGRTLDHGIVANIMQALEVGSNEKIKMTFQYKLSGSLQNAPEMENFDGTRRFTADDNTHLKGMFQSLTSDYPFIKKGELARCTSQLKSEKFADEKYDMSCSEGLADFVKWSKLKYPDAKRTILIITSHGNGWNFVYDGKKDTRSIISDDNTGSRMSLGNVVKGINEGGGVDLLYADACLMSTYENLYGYAQCTKYLLASYETAPAVGGDYRKLITLLRNTGTGNSDMEASLKAFVDYIVGDEWWGKYSQRCRDIAFYDLSRLNEVTVPLKKIANTLAEKYVSEESIEPTTESPLGDKFAPYIRWAAQNCVVSDAETSVSYKNLPRVIVNAMLEDGYQLDSDDCFDLDDLVRWIRFAETDRAKETFENYPDEWNTTRYVIAQMNENAYSVTDLLRILDNNLTEIGAKNPFAPLRSELLTALRSIGHIGCTKSFDPSLLDTSYELCSPGLTLLPLNELYDNVVTNPVAKDIPDYADALRYYQNTTFDKEVQWSQFLQVLDITPSALTNNMRQNYVKQ